MKFALAGVEESHQPVSRVGLTPVFNAYLPEVRVIPDYLYQTKGRSCATCERSGSCGEHLRDVTDAVRRVLSWRDMDEVHQLKAAVRGVVRKRSSQGGTLDCQELLEELRDLETRLRHRVRSVFPKVRRWTNITMVVSLPLALAGMAGSGELALAGGAAVAASQVTKEILDYLTSRYSWIGFRTTPETTR